MTQSTKMKYTQIENYRDQLFIYTVNDSEKYIRKCQPTFLPTQSALTMQAWIRHGQCVPLHISLHQLGASTNKAKKLHVSDLTTFTIVLMGKIACYFENSIFILYSILKIVFKILFFHSFIILPPPLNMINFSIVQFQILQDDRLKSVHHSRVFLQFHLAMLNPCTHKSQRQTLALAPGSNIHVTVITCLTTDVKIHIQMFIAAFLCILQTKLNVDNIQSVEPKCMLMQRTLLSGISGRQYPV